jgi:hypothetical protein
MGIGTLVASAHVSLQKDNKVGGLQEVEQRHQTHSTHHAKFEFSFMDSVDGE